MITFARRVGLAPSISRLNRYPPAPRTLTPRLFSSTTSGNIPSSKRKLFACTAITLAGLSAATHGQTKNFYDHRFIVSLDPDDLAGFYGGEEFMELFCVLPFVGTLMMRGGTFDDEGNVHTTGIPGDMEVSMVFSDEDDDYGRTVWFNKRERFKDTFMGYKCWDMVSNFGFRTLPNKKLEVYHTGEYFVSNFPPISSVVFLVFKFHSMWLTFATSHHLKYHAFRSETDDEEEIEEKSRTDMPLHLLVDVLPYEFLKQIGFSSINPCKDESTYAPEEEAIPEEVESREVHLNKIMSQVTSDIKKDREYNKEVVLRRIQTLKIDPEVDNVNEIEAEIDLRAQRIGKDLGGPVAWEALKRTNNPQAYLKATRAAIKRRQTRVGKPLGRKGTRVDKTRSAGRKS
ncbi:hypothetical protein TrLO_g12804 [Triparma laevis f. longispina]|uniref:Uncharacterized protein n=1 Tax=Triparma laevis f. longispina TaxID=1714387 RepID=A0A9W6ZGU9_9STRA|nr:hypothetical protein TrLO_g12804 [Triparma laevis f. longispina]